MPRNLSDNECIDKAVDAIKPGTPFQSGKLNVRDLSSRKISAILKARIRCPENPTGDLHYCKGEWIKLEPINA